MRGTKFYLNFKNDSTGRKAISEPVGFDSADFAIIQEDDRLGRDVQFAGGNGKFSFSRMKHSNVWDDLQRYYAIFGFESDIDLEIDYMGLGNIIIIGSLDFFKSTNNTFDIITCDVILGQDQMQIKRNIEAKNDLFSSLDIDGNIIFPVESKNILLKSKPLVQLSSFKQNSSHTAQTGGIGGVTTRFYNFANMVVNDGIDDTLSFIQGFGNREDFAYVEALDTLTNVTLKISNLNLVSREIASSYPFGQGFVGLRYYVGESNANPPETAPQLFSLSFYNTPQDQQYTISNGKSKGFIGFIFLPSLIENPL